LFHLEPAPLPPRYWGRSFPYFLELSHDVKGERKLILSNDEVLIHAFREDGFNTAK